MMAARYQGAGPGLRSHSPGQTRAWHPTVAPGHLPALLVVPADVFSPPGRSVQTFADKSKQEALKNDLVEALKRKQQC